eukprot:3379588-Pyramimonas_sp.AAC.1
MKREGEEPEQEEQEEEGEEEQTILFSRHCFLHKQPCCLRHPRKADGRELGGSSNMGVSLETSSHKL